MIKAQHRILLCLIAFKAAPLSHLPQVATPKEKTNSFTLTPSWFGKIAACFKPQTQVHFNHQGVVIFDDNHAANAKHVLTWLQLSAPVRLQQGWLGCRCHIVIDNAYLKVKWQGYRTIERYQSKMLAYWAHAHQPGLEQLIDKVTPYYQRRYLRQSHFNQLSQAINQAYLRWAPIIKYGDLPAKLNSQLKQLATIAQWQKQGVTDIQDRFAHHQLQQFQSLFDNLEQHPLTLAQRQACVMDDDNNLLLAGAGSGKTSVMIGRVVYLVTAKQAQAAQILMLAYGKQAAGEMQQRLQQHQACSEVTCRTFHSLALHIIQKATGHAPEVSQLALDDNEMQRWLRTHVEEILVASAGQKALLPYFCYLQPVQSATALHGVKCGSVLQRHVVNFLFSQSITVEIDPEGPFTDGIPVDIYLPEQQIYLDICEADSERLAPLKCRQQEAKSKGLRYQVFTLAKGGELKQINTMINRLKKQLQQWDVQIHTPVSASFLDWLMKSEAFESLLKCLTQGLNWFAQAEQRGNVSAINDYIKSQGTQGSLNHMAAVTEFKWLKQLQSRYQKALKLQGQVDFESMIVKATELVNKGKFNSPWSHILVDEFQDIALNRAQLIKALQQSHGDASLFAVGDDWQAIYGFNGAELNLTTEFASHFSPSRQHCLDKTFRLNSQVSAVASRFIMANPKQLVKKIHAHKQETAPQVYVYRYLQSQAKSSKAKQSTMSTGDMPLSDNHFKAIKRCLNKVKNEQGKEAPLEILLLARFKHQLPDAVRLDDIKKAYPHWSFSINTVHAAKGKEADICLILGLNQGRYGFPAHVNDDDLPANTLLQWLKSGPNHGVSEEQERMEEECRLFYVALTRAKQQVFLLADKHAPSVFVEALLSDEYPEVSSL